MIPDVSWPTRSGRIRQKGSRPNDQILDYLAVCSWPETAKSGRLREASKSTGTRANTREYAKTDQPDEGLVFLFAGQNVRSLQTLCSGR